MKYFKIEMLFYFQLGKNNQNNIVHLFDIDVYYLTIFLNKTKIGNSLEKNLLNYIVFKIIRWNRKFGIFHP